MQALSQDKRIKISQLYQSILYISPSLNRGGTFFCFNIFHFYNKKNYKNMRNTGGDKRRRVEMRIKITLSISFSASKIRKSILLM